MASPALRVLESGARVYRRTWRGSVITTFVNPVLYLAAMGLGLGSLVDQGAGTAELGGISYIAFLAPGLLAAATMQTGAGDGAWPVMAGMKWRKTYQATLATPVGVRDLVFGHLGWVLVRVLITAVVFVLVTILFGAVSVADGVGAIGPAVLTGMAFAAAVTAYTAALSSEYGLSSLFRFGIVPMFLFSGTFFPITQLPGWIQPLAYVTPLWNGVELTRAAALGVETAWPAMWHAAYLLVWVVAGTAISVVNFRRKLEI